MGHFPHQRCVVGGDEGARLDGTQWSRGRANSEPMGLENTILISPSLGLFPDPKRSDPVTLGAE